MLLLFETPAGYALFKVLKESKLQDVENLWKEFEDPEKASSIVKLKAFRPFDGTAEAVAAASDIIESNLGKELKKFLKKSIKDKEMSEQLAVADHKLGGLIKDKLGLNIATGEIASELFRGVRTQLDSLLTGLSDSNLKQMQLGLSHSLSRYKLKFSADKVDTMIVQAIGLLDELDKEINTYAMRVREWYGWHFPELVKIVNDNVQYAKLVVRVGMRTGFKNQDLSDILGDDAVEQSVKESAEISMGQEISENDLASIRSLAQEVVDLAAYRINLFEYLKNRMHAIAPNLTIMVGELVGARLIAHAGSLLNLAKHPASTIQILGAEKALFRALKTKHDTPKYGLIYHASLIGQAQPKHKGKISRVLAAKTALAIRVDAMGDETDTSMGEEARSKVEFRLRQLEGGHKTSLTGGMRGSSSGNGGPAKYDKKAALGEGEGDGYNEASDMVGVTTEVGSAEKKKKKKEKEKRKRESEGAGAEEGGMGASNGQALEIEEETPSKKKKKKSKTEASTGAEEEEEESPKKKKKKDKKKEK
ncbi:nucleolar protein expressed [Nannochloropsis gaditana]|uniref:Nucleolar protein expressed n=1 Tax=Nannochloropsis gaditana TaxID=72520 RepID=W7TXA7_9STRA|nr:nucleolar protein expressed [Nannochloropsis gaditana]